MKHAIEWNRNHAKFLSLLLGTFLFLSHSYAQEKTAKGKVTDEQGNPLAGVSVVVSGTSRGTSTNVNGEFEIGGLTTRNRLLFSFTGFADHMVSVGNRTNFSVALRRASKDMDEVIVVGYGSRKKSEVTGAISSVKSEELTQTPIANLAQGLQGRVAGLQIVQNNAAPGGSISVRLRGTNSINGTSEPLYIIDGIQVQNNTGSTIPGVTVLNNVSAVGGNSNEVSPLSNINPDDIESVEVLKDASAAAIYGSQAANGVVIITTKRGKAGVSRISYDGYYGIQEVTKKIPLLNATEFAKLENEIYDQPRYSNPDSLGQGTDWQDEIFRQAKIQNHQLTFSGGNEKTQVLMALNYFDQDGVVLSSNFKRYSFRLNLDHRVNDWLKIGTTTTLTRSVNSRIQTGSINSDGGALTQSLVGAALQAPPTLKPYLQDGSIFLFPNQPFGGYYGELRNPLNAAFTMDKTNVNTILSNVYLDFNVAKGLDYKASFSAYSTNSLNDYYFPAAAFTPAELAINGGLGGYGLKNNSNSLRLIHESIVSYDKVIAKDHSISLTGVFSTLLNNNNYNYMSGNGFVNDATKNEALQLAQNFSINTGRSKDNLLSYLGRVSYNFRGKYFIDLTGRADGSSKFGENNKYGFFPAASFAWNIAQEPFLENANAIDNIKLRLSIGTTGNQGAIGPYQSLATAAAGSDYAFNNNYTRGIAPTGVPNPDLKWEKSTQSNVGLDVDLFNNRLNFVVDAYHKKTVDLIFSKSLPLSSGYGTIVGNFASLENKGIELSLNVTPIRNKNLTWSVNTNFTINRNKLLRLADDSTDEFAINNYNILAVGQPLGIFKTYVFDGIHQTGDSILPGQPVTNPRAGTHRVADIAGEEDGKPDGIISDADRIISGNANPKFIYSFSSNLRFKQFDLAVFFSGVYGNDVFNLAAYQLENPIGSRNVLKNLVNRWSPSNPSTEYQSGTGSLGGRLPLSDKYIEDGSFLRCKNISLGYTLPRIKGIGNAQ